MTQKSKNMPSDELEDVIMNQTSVFCAVYRSKMTGEELRRNIVAPCYEEAVINAGVLEKELARGEVVFEYKGIEGFDLPEPKESKPNGFTRRVDYLGRILIPKEIRKYIGILEGDEMNIEFCKNAIVMTPVKDMPMETVELAISQLPGEEYSALKAELQSVISKHKLESR